MELFTDASLIRFGVFFQNQWFWIESPVCLLSVQDSDLLMAFHEPYSIVAAMMVKGKYWVSICILFISDNEATVHNPEREIKVFTENETNEKIDLDCCDEPILLFKFKR